MKVCLLAAGKGTRNSSVKGLHKALLPLENKPAISHIIDKIPISTQIIIAVGYKSSQIKSYINDVHSIRDIIFVDVDNYEGKNSGPGYSLLCCEKYLQEPFVFTSIDTIIEETYPYIECNYDWIGASRVEEKESNNYCLIEPSKNNQVGSLYYGSGNLAYIGIAGIYNYEKFWNNLKSNKLINNEHQVINGFENLNLEIVKCKWYDIGNDNSYSLVKKIFKNDVVANKSNEALFIDNKKVVKFFDDTNRVKQRMQRINFLPQTTIKLINENMYSYEYIEGKLLSNIYNEKVFEKFLDFISINFFSYRGIKDSYFLNNCKIMYEEKTNLRLNRLLNTELDHIKYINGIETCSMAELIKKIDWKKIYDCAIPAHFHGDLQPENIIYDNKGNFYIIDWRESFGSSLEYGDIYYDLSKLYHGLLINGSNILKGHYDYNITNDSVEIDFLIKNNLFELHNLLKKFCETNNYSWSNTSLLGIIHYLNICSLYEEFNNNKYGNFLFLYGKYLLTKWISENG